MKNKIIYKKKIQYFQFNNFKNYQLLIFYFKKKYII